MEHAISTPNYSTYRDIPNSLRLVTPQMAEEILAKNTRNRPINKAYVRQLRRDLEEGRWKVTHQGVALADDGTVLDGQHRLLAIRDSGIAAPLFVAEGVDHDAFDAIDQHLKRTGGQVLAMAGVTKDAPRIMAMAKAILAVVYGVTKPANTEAAQFAVKHQTELELFLPVSRQYTPAVGAAFAWCATLGWGETIGAAERLLSTIWQDPAEFDPMRALHNRARNFSELGAGQSGIKARFDIALNCLEAVHDQRGLKVAKSYRPDYGKLERESLRPHEDRNPLSVRIPAQDALPNVTITESKAVPAYLKRRERDEQEAERTAPPVPMGGNIDDHELIKAIEEEAAKSRKGRKSLAE